MTTREHRDRQGLLVISCLYTFLFAGVYYGWGPIQLLLEANGAFQSRCTVEEQFRGEVCPAQSAALLNVNFIASLTKITAPLLGWIVDRYKAKTLFYLMAACLLVSLVLMITEVDSLLYISIALMGLATWMGGILTIQTGTS
jgi:MFS family permease